MSERTRRYERYLDENRESVRADAMPPATCPECGAELDWEPPNYVAGKMERAGFYHCDECGFTSGVAQ